ncbi:TPA: autotransporter outer membrane beta-barrel domain-containing protein [Yersinia enterocolitica]|nr:autotransporter outer membrane beta-barrel domain-containing protein [Yersinia enterocolitica]HEN3300562.1 autotransporter outer membrane beta-barrel domain-containing protein [Yersinia enterocolitica]HEN3391208.1 autotransporter outer membrane beta-barrel domain-containing protein [Yersinia enterocolitica]
MNHRNTLNTRLLPLSILISSLVSGGAMAAPTAVFDETKYTPVTAGTVVTDNTKWTEKVKTKIQKIADLIDESTTAKKEAETKLEKNKVFEENLKITKQYASQEEAKKAANDAELAVTQGASQVKAVTNKLVAKNNGTITGGNPGEKEQAVIGNNAVTTDKSTLEGLIAEVRAKQDAYLTALQTAKGKANTDADKATTTDFNDVDIKKTEFDEAVTKLETQKLDSNKTLTDDYANQLSEFYSEIGLDENKKELDRAYTEITTFKDLVTKKEAAKTNLDDFNTAKNYQDKNPDHKLTPKLILENKNIVNNAEKSIKEFEKLKKEATPILTQGTAQINSKELARNEVVDTVDQTIETGGASLNNHIIGKTQTIKNGAIAVNSTISGTSGKQILEEGAQAKGTEVNTDARLENNGGTDFDSIINDGGELALKGTDKNNTAKSYNAKINTGGKATFGEFSEVEGLKSAGGTIALNKSAIAKNISISGGQLTIEAGATADSTELTDTVLNLVEGATANGTLVNKDSSFTLEKNAETSGTHVYNEGIFTLKEGSKASTSFLYGGKTTVKKDAIINNTVLADTDSSDSAELILEDGAVANGIEVYGNSHTLNISTGATATDTKLHFAKLTLQNGQTADGTKLYDGSTFTLINDAKTQDTLVHDGKFIVENNAEATNTTLEGGEFTLKSNAKATGTTVNGGQFIVNDGAIATDTKVKGGIFELKSKMQAMKLEVDDGLALISSALEGVTLNGGTTIFDKAAEITGTIEANKGSFLSVHDGAKTESADLNLAGNMVLVAEDAPYVRLHPTSRAAFNGINGKPAKFAFQKVKLDGGSIDMSQTNAQLTMQSLTGNGSFNLGSALYNHATAPLNVTGDANGDFDVQINDSGVAPANLNIVDVKGVNTARFALSNGPVNLGNYKHNLVSDGKGGFKLVADKTALTPGAAGILAVANTTPTIFNAELSSIQNRLDKQSASANESGVWLTYLNDNYDVKGTATNFKQKLNGMTLGGDKAMELGEAVFSIGAFASHSSSNIKSDYQSSGSVESNSLGAYAQYLANSGYYLNGVMKTNQFKQNLNVTAKGSNASGNANFSGLGLAVKAGKHITIDELYVSPFVAMSSFTSGKSQYQLSNGMEAQSQGARTTTGTIGMNTGYRFVLNSGAEIKPYAIFSVDHDLMAKNDVVINNEMFDNSLKGTRANAGVGVNVNLTSNLSVGSEVKVSKGKNIATPMTINMGVAYTF